MRHGDKEPGDFWNPALGGHNDQPLSGLGRAEAQEVCAWISSRGVGAIHASRYARTAETAAPLSALLGVGIEAEPLLDEIDVGVTDRLAPGELEARFPEFVASRRRPGEDPRYPGGESGADVAQRVAAFLARALARGVDAAAFTHEGWAKVAACVALGLSAAERWRFRCDTCGLTELEWNAQMGRWDLVRANSRP